MKAEQLIEQALALSDEEITRWLSSPARGPAPEAVQDFGPITDRRLRAFIAYFHKLEQQFDAAQYESADPTCLLPKAYEAAVELGSSMDLMRSLVTHQVAEVYRSKIEAKYRGSEYILAVGPNGHMLRIRVPGNRMRGPAQVAAIVLRAGLRAEDDDAPQPPAAPLERKLH